MNKIKSVSCLFRYLFIIGLIAWPVWILTFWISNGYAFLFGHTAMITYVGVETYPWLEHTKNLPAVTSLTDGVKTIAATISFIPTLIEMAVFYFLIRLFRLYEEARIFTTENVHYIRLTGLMIFLSQIILPFYEALMTFVLTSHNPVGKHFITISFGNGNIKILIIALLIMLIAWIMDEGRKIQDEQQLTV